MSRPIAASCLLASIGLTGCGCNAPWGEWGNRYPNSPRLNALYPCVMRYEPYEAFERVAKAQGIEPETKAINGHVTRALFPLDGEHAGKKLDVWFGRSGRPSYAGTIDADGKGVDFFYCALEK